MQNDYVIAVSCLLLTFLLIKPHIHRPGSPGLCGCRIRMITETSRLSVPVNLENPFNLLVLSEFIYQLTETNLLFVIDDGVLTMCNSAAPEGENLHGQHRRSPQADKSYKLKMIM